MFLLRVGILIMRKSTAWYILAIAIILILSGFIFNIHIIKAVFQSLTAMLTSPYIIAPAAICAFIFITSRNYWLLNSICAFVTSLVIQYGIYEHGDGIYTILVRALAFLVVVYLLNLLKIIFNR